MSEVLSSTLSELDVSGRPERPAPLCPHLFIVLECGRPLASSGRHSLVGIDEVTIGRGAARTVQRRFENGKGQLLIEVPDRWMSSRHAQLSRSNSEWRLRDQESKNGSIVNASFVREVLLRDGDLLELGHTLFIFREALPTPEESEADLDLAQASQSSQLTTLLPLFEHQLRSLELLARSPLAVLIEGETGTGKELIARALHELAKRPGPFVAVNCGALPETLIPTELFGYRKGAFTGAVRDQPGLVRSAQGGTLFLDEVGELPLTSQATLLRVLQEHEVVPVGGTRPVPVDIRVIAATNRDLRALAAGNAFRADLLARLSGFTLRLPPLRERREDLGLLISALLRRVAADSGALPTFSTAAARALFSHHWPFNIRELENALSAAFLLARSASVNLEHLPESVRRGAREPSEPSVVQEPRAGVPLSDEDVRLREELVALLREHRGNISSVARAVGKARMQIHRWMKRYGIEPKHYSQ